MAKKHDDWTSAFDKIAFNRFDSSLVCNPTTFKNTPEFYMLIAFLAMFFVVGPLYMMVKAWREMLIEYSAMLAKIGLVLINKYLIFSNEFIAVILAALVVSA